MNIQCCKSCCIPWLSDTDCCYRTIQSQFCYRPMLGQVQGRERPHRGFIKDQATIFEKWKDNPGCLLFYNLKQDSQWSCLLDKMHSGNDFSECKGPIHVQWGFKQRGRQGRVDKIEAEGCSDWPKGTAPSVSQEALLLDLLIPTKFHEVRIATIIPISPMKKLTLKQNDSFQDPQALSDGSIV